MVSSPVDVYQARYLEHRLRKRRFIVDELGETCWSAENEEALFSVLRTRRSQRVFDGEQLTEIELNRIYEAIRLAPSSCNRQAILVKPITDKLEKEWLGHLLVGGTGWLAKAYVVLLLFADMAAYKSPAEVDFMPWLDAGFVGENVYLAATALNIGACFVNPNIRLEDRPEFDRLFNLRSHLFCGAMALGRYTVRAPEPSKRRLEEIFY